MPLLKTTMVDFSLQIIAIVMNYLKKISNLLSILFRQSQFPKWAGLNFRRSLRRGEGGG